MFAPSVGDLTNLTSCIVYALPRKHRRLEDHSLVHSNAPTAWDFSQELGNLGVDLGFGDFAVQSWNFTVVKEIKF